MNNLKFVNSMGLKAALSFLIFVVATFVIIANNNIIATICAYISLSVIATLAIHYNRDGESADFRRKIITLFLFFALLPSIAWLARQIAS